MTDAQHVDAAIAELAALERAHARQVAHGLAGWAFEERARGELPRAASLARAAAVWLARSESA